MPQSGCAASHMGGAMKKSFVRGTWQRSRAFSPAVITEGGKVIWIAGHTGQQDPAGNSLAGDFDAQTRQTFKNIEATLREAGASLKDIVTMTVFLADSRYTTRMTEIRTEILGEDLPASGAVSGTGFADPRMLIGIQGIQVVAEDDRTERRNGSSPHFTREGSSK